MTPEMEKKINSIARNCEHSAQLTKSRTYGIGGEAEKAGKAHHDNYLSIAADLRKLTNSGHRS